LQHPEQAPLHERLSARELQILSLIGAGRSAKQIADELSISANTVNTHRARILQKMQLRTNSALIRYTIEHGLA
jgi:two-component system, NarL family, invasion response regulator UvrY